MQPIDQRIDNSLCQALSCAEARFPRVQGLKTSAAELSIALRYSLIGIAATCHLLEEAPRAEHQKLLRQIKLFGTMIHEHVDIDAQYNPKHLVSPTQASRAQEVYRDLFARYCEIRNFACTVDLTLSVLVEDFINAHEKELRGSLLFLNSRSARRRFEQEAHLSLRYALCFYERRKFNLEEVPEIALLGE